MFCRHSPLSILFNQTLDFVRIAPLMQTAVTVEQKTLDFPALL
jgi:hypothetical protein